jgi:hypothetical protein
MRTKLTIIAALALAQIAHASLIELTPGGYTGSKPPIVQEWFQNHYNKDAFAIGGNSLEFGIWGMGQYVTVTGLGTPTLTLSWDLTGTGYFVFDYIFVRDYPGLHASLYAVKWDPRMVREGTVVIDGVLPITAIDFFGLPFGEVADSGASLSLFVGAATVLIFSHHFRQFCKVRRR